MEHWAKIFFGKITPKHVQNTFGLIFSKKIFAQCSMVGRVFENFQKNQKIFKNRKMPIIVPKGVQTCFEHVLGVIFSKNFFAQLEGRVFENFQKNQKIFKNRKMPNIVPKSVQTCFEHVLG